MSQAVIRRAGKPDIPALVRLLQESDAFHASGRPDTFQAPDPPIRTADYAGKLVAEENGTVLVAERNGRVVGLVQAAFYAGRSSPSLVDRPYVVIGDLVVSETSRRAGIGRALLRAAHDWAKERGAAEIELGVWEFNKGAIALYESLGYRAVYRRMSRPLE